MTWLAALGVLAVAVLLIRQIASKLDGPASPTVAFELTQEPLPSRSFYALAISYDFDGARASTELYVYNALEHLQSCVTQQLLPAKPDLIEHVLRKFSTSLGNATAYVFTFIEGRPVAAMSLTELLRVRSGEQVEPLHLARNDEQTSQLAGCRLELDWDQVRAALPALTGTLLRPGEAASVVVPTELKDVWLGDDDHDDAFVVYGFLDVVYPREPANLPFIDPDPA